MSIEIEIKKQLEDFSLDIHLTSSCRRIGILGASGSGKSMTLKAIAGIEIPDAGRICVDERVLFDSRERTNLRPQKRKVGYLFQNYALFPTMTVAANIEAGLTGNKSEKKARAAAMIEKFRLQGLENRFPGELSGGQQQRTALARILAYEPEVILLDEPFSALDIFLKDQLQQELEDLLRDYRGTVILVSHSRDEIYRFSEEVLVIDEGKTICQGRTREIFADPQKKEAAILTGCKNIAEIKRIDEWHLEVPEWGLRLNLKKKVAEDVRFVGVRAHDLIPVWGNEEENCLPVEIESIAELPFERRYFLNSPGGGKICWFVQRERWAELEEKEIPQYLEFPKEKLLLLK